MPMPLLPKHGLQYMAGMTVGSVVAAVFSVFNVSIILWALLVVIFYFVTEKYAYQGGKLGCQDKEGVKQVGSQAGSVPPLA